MDFRTDIQRRRDRRNAEIRADYAALRSQYGEQSNAAIFRVLATKYGVGIGTCRNACLDK